MHWRRLGDSLYLTCKVTSWWHHSRQYQSEQKADVKAWNYLNFFTMAIIKFCGSSNLLSFLFRLRSGHSVPLQATNSLHLLHQRQAAGSGFLSRTIYLHSKIEELQECLAWTTLPVEPPNLTDWSNQCVAEGSVNFPKRITNSSDMILIGVWCSVTTF